MKAKDYYAKYGERLMNCEGSEYKEAFHELVREFIDEMNSVVKQRKVRTEKAYLAVIDEFNNKWNALCEMFPTPIFNRNGYKTYCYEMLEIPKEYADYVRRGRI